MWQGRAWLAGVQTWAVDRVQTALVDLVHTVLVDRFHRSKGYAIWSVDSEMDGSGGLGCFTWLE